MYPVVGFGGYELTANEIIVIFCLYLVITGVASAGIPAYFIRKPAGDTSLATTEKILDLREKLRGSVLKFFGGIAVLCTALVGIQTFRSSEDTFRKAKLDLFNASVKSLLDDGKALKDNAEAMQTLAFVSRSDPSYHRAVFDALSNYVTHRSRAACTDRGAVKNLEIRMAVRIIGERDPTHDKSKKRLNIEHACLIEVDLRDEYDVIRGLRNARLSNANLLRSDFTKADLYGAEMKGITASDYMNPKWSTYFPPKQDPSKRRSLHPSEKGDSRETRDRLNGYERRLFITHFVDANLEEADFAGAGIAGADFSGARLANASFQDANVSRANFNGAQGLKAKQLQAACVGNSKMSADELREAQPFLWDKLRAEIGKAGIKACKI